MPKPAAPRYRTTNWPEYNAVLKRRRSLEIRFDPEMDWLSKPCSPWSSYAVFGQRYRAVPDVEGAVQFAAAASDGIGGKADQNGGAGLAGPGLYDAVPATEGVDGQGGRTAQLRLHLLVDSTGIKMTGEGEWRTRKHGASYRRQWRKVHLGIDAETLDIRAIEVTTNAIGDTPTLPGLRAQIPKDEQILSVGGDSAYDTKACHAAIAKRSADAIIPVRRNGSHGRKTVPA